ncbi:hypothetical protein B0H11DRAFT_2233407 [Mycena galericulata]|nr:hypothetical protein B0H11DRAFT_2233407 [Mycena galericulata]
MNYTVDPIVFKECWDLAISHGYAFSVEVFLYGIFLVLLSIAAHLLYHRTSPGRRSLSTAMSLMALLATAHLGLYYRMSVLAYEVLRPRIGGEVWPQSAHAIGIQNELENLHSASNFVLVVNNLVTDGLFVYRCFVVWGRNVRVVFAPILMLLATTVLGYLVSHEDWVKLGGLDTRVPFIMSALTNIILIGLTAGRIWWIRRDACALSESAAVRAYNTVIAIILESGAIYCFSVLIFLICVSVSSVNNQLITIVFLAAVPQIMNIASTLIIVRVGLGRAFEDTAGSEHGREAFPHAVRPPRSTLELQARVPSAIIDIRATREDDNVSLSEQDKRAYELHPSSKGPSGAMGVDTEIP